MKEKPNKPNQFSGGTVSQQDLIDGKPMVVSVAIVPKEIVELQSLAQAINEQAESLKDTIIHGANRLAESYLHLCRHIRSHAIPPKTVSAELKTLGFPKSRISEINRVSQCADALWKEYDARQIGWRGALEVSRERIIDLAEVPGEDTAEEDTAEQSESTEKTEEDKEAARLAGRNRAAKAIINSALKDDIRSQKWKLNGYVLQLTREKKKKKEDDGSPDSE